jgi:diketogulonate reductase-like aldo/keto reductase
MEKVFASGRAKAIGIANYSVRYLKQLLPHVTVVPAVNQIENHPLLPQQEIVEFCEGKGIHITAYSPLGSSGSPLIHLPVIKGIAERRTTTPAVILVSWHGTLKQAPAAYPRNQSFPLPHFTRGLYRLWASLFKACSN